MIYSDQEMLEFRNAAVAKARESGYNKGKIAKAVGITPSYMWHILSTPAPHRNTAPKLDAWLKKRGFWPEEGLSREEVVEPVNALPGWQGMLAVELQTLAKVVLDPTLSGEAKARWFRTGIENLHSGLDEYTKFFRSSGDHG